MARRVTKPKLSSLSPALQRAFVDAKIKENLALFVQRAFETVVPGEQFRLNWHIYAITHALQQVMDGKIKRLIITIPPRSLKSITASVAFPAFVLGHDPTRKFICVSYSKELVSKHANDFRAVMGSDFYRRIFPGTKISTAKNTEQETLTTMRGGRFSTSVGGTLTGRGGNFILIDDPMNPQQAFSEAERQNVLRFYRSTLLSRLNSKTDDAIVVIMQRLHMDDLVGTLLEERGWHHLNIPAIAEDNQRIRIGPNKFYTRRTGSVIDPTREPRRALDELKRQMGSLEFSSQYQQRPIPFEGNIIKREWFRYYDQPPPPLPGDKYMASWDTALKANGTSDFTVGTFWLVRRDTCYLLDRVRGRFDFPDLKRVVMAARDRYRGLVTLVEDKGSGISLIQDLRNSNFAVTGIVPKEEKIQRLASASTLFEGGSVYFPRNAPWLQDLEAELLGFPSVRHDDQVDSVSQLLNRIKNGDGVVIFGPLIFTPGVSLQTALARASGREAMPTEEDEAVGHYKSGRLTESGCNSHTMRFGERGHRHRGDL
jgi:predicted phage terminase large subunit-like protein